MTEFGKTICPECGAGNGLGAPRCAACGLTLMRPGMAARPVDDDDEDEAPRRPLKKPARPAEDAVQKETPRPTKKPAPKRPIDDDYDDEDEAPRRPSKKPISRRDDDDAEEDEPESMRDNTLLNMLFPVGVSIWAMLSNYLGVGGLLLTVFGFALAGTGVRLAGVILPIAGGLFCFLAIPLGGLSFILRPKKRTYGGVTSYMRAIIGILCGLAGVVAAPLVIWWLSKNI
jgi:ribosomal protein L40E